MNTALVLIDIQNDYFPGGRFELSRPAEAEKRARQALDFFREKDRLIFHVQHVSLYAGASFFLPDTPGVAFREAVAPRPGERVVVKHTPDAFFETDLAAALEEAAIQKLIVCGMMSHMCIDTSVRSAKRLGYEVVVLEDACTTRDSIWDGETIPAATVHRTFMAALNGAFATVRPTDAFLAS
ncbi:MAG: cysteine hydrolase family protein [Bilophila sp.]